MSSNTPFMKVNDSDKQRPSDSTGKILPDAMGHTSGEEAGCGEKMKQRKFLIIGVLVGLIVVIILAVTLTGGGGDKPPGPTPPGPNPPAPDPPVPVNRGYNPYYLNSSSIVQSSKNKMSGTLYFNTTLIPNTTFGYGYGNGTDALNITLEPNKIPHGINNNYSESITYDFSQVDYKITKVKFTDDKKTRYAIPNDLVKDMPDSYNMSLDTVGFKMF